VGEKSGAFNQEWQPPGGCDRAQTSDQKKEGSPLNQEAGRSCYWGRKGGTAGITGRSTKPWPRGGARNPKGVRRYVAKWYKNTRRLHKKVPGGGKSSCANRIPERKTSGRVRKKWGGRGHLRQGGGRKRFAKGVVRFKTRGWNPKNEAQCEAKRQGAVCVL